MPAAEVTEDSLLGGRVRLAQPARGYRAAIDPVLLAAGVQAPPGARVADLGCGVGAVALCLLTRVGEIKVRGLEIQEDLAQLARGNARANGLDVTFAVETGDILAPPAAFGPGSFDQVVFNPPFTPAAAGRPSPSPGRALANQESDAGLEDWIGAALKLLVPKGRLTFIQRADRLEAVLAALAGRAGGIDVFPLWPEAGRPAKRVIVTARKGVAAPSRLSAGLVLHAADGSFTPEAQAVLQDAVPLVRVGP
jgi:tRNA1(Val) A37 N6-methylase TrmN6